MLATSAPGSGSTRAAFCAADGVRFGNTGRNQFYGPGGNNLDFSLFRSFPMGGTPARAASRGTTSSTRGVRQPAEQHHVGHVRPDHRHRRHAARQRGVYRAADPARSAVQLLSDDTDPVRRESGAFGACRSSRGVICHPTATSVAFC